MSGLPLLGSIHATQPGHELNNRLLEKIFESDDNYKVTELKSYQMTVPHQENIIDNINVA